MKRFVVLLLPLLAALLPVVGNSNAANRAGVVIRYADGTVRIACVTFDEESISGLDLLQRATPDVIAQAAPGNAAVCKIGGDGCDYPAEPCFCTFGTGNSGEYWAYWQLDGRTWRYGQQGAGARRARDGDVDGWAYGSGSVESGTQPPVITFEEVCPLASEPRPAASVTIEPLRPTPPDMTLATPPASAVETASASSAPASTAAGAATPGGAGGGQPAGGWGGYAVFGAMLAAVLGAIVVALRRRGTG